MKKIIVVGSFVLGLLSLSGSSVKANICTVGIHDTIPVLLPADFTDDYGIGYWVSDTLWLQKPRARYHILRWNRQEQYIIARNGDLNTSNPGMFTRIDYMRFSNMEPYRWGFCLSVYDAKSDSLAEFGPRNVDRSNPRKGCNGFPFSRMKVAE